MADAVLLFRTHLGKGSFVSFWHEDWVVAKTALTTFFVDDVSIHFSFEIVVGIIGHKGNHRAKICFAVLLALQFTEQFVHIGLRVVTLFRSIASRVYTWLTIQSLHFESRVIGKAIESIEFLHEMCLLIRILTEGLACLRDVLTATDVFQTAHFEVLA